ncbi:hypothetical protein GF420_09210 [candidate division GN15 bacterium]|nr:hypothetical protein [candidate division GN15 bacterium]
MYQPVIDWLVVLFFLVALVFVWRFRTSMHAVDRESYRQISTGLAVLSLVALLRLYNHYGVFEPVPFLSEPLFFRLIGWIGIITGIMFLISGMSSWLPLARRLRENESSRRTIQSLLREIEQLVAVEHRMDPLLADILDHIVTAYHFEQGAVYAVAADGSDVRLIDARGEKSERKQQLRQARFNPAGWRRYSDDRQAPEVSGILTDLPIELGTPSVLLPIVVKDRPRAVIVLWSSERTELEPEDRQTLGLIAEIIARRMAEALTQLKIRFLEHCNRLRDEMNRAINISGARPEALPVMAREIAAVMPIDYLSLIILHPTRPICDRYSVGGQWQLLAQKSLPWPGGNRLLAEVLVGDETMVADRDPAQLDDFPPNFLPADLRSIAMAGIRIEGQPGGLLLLGSERPQAFGHRTAAIVEAILPTLAHLVYSHTERSVDRDSRRRFDRLVELVTEGDRAGSVSALCDRVTDFLWRELHVEAVRIATVDRSGAFLDSRAVRTTRPTEHMAPAEAPMVLSLMEAHQEALDRNELIRLDESEIALRMSEAERSILYLPEITEAVIVPMSVHGRALGTITLADTRADEAVRVDDEAVTLVRTAAQMLAGALLMSIDAGAIADRSRSRVFSLGEESDESEPNIRSSLTGLLGSTEALRTTWPTDPAKADRYLSIIDRSARQLGEYMKMGPITS